MRLFNETEERVRNGLKEAISLLCKTGLQFQSELSIDGLLGITLDKNEVFLVSIKEVIKTAGEFQAGASAKPPESSSSTSKAKTSNVERRKRKAGEILHIPRHTVPQDYEEDDDGDDYYDNEVIEYYGSGKRKLPTTHVGIGSPVADACDGVIDLRHSSRTVNHDVSHVSPKPLNLATWARDAKTSSSVQSEPVASGSDNNKSFSWLSVPGSSLDVNATKRKSTVEITDNALASSRNTESAEHFPLIRDSYEVDAAVNTRNGGVKPEVVEDAPLAFKETCSSDFSVTNFIGRNTKTTTTHAGNESRKGVASSARQTQGRLGPSEDSGDRSSSEAEKALVNEHLSKSADTDCQSSGQVQRTSEDEDTRHSDYADSMGPLVIKEELPDAVETDGSTRDSLTPRTVSARDASPNVRADETPSSDASREDSSASFSAMTSKSMCTVSSVTQGSSSLGGSLGVIGDPDSHCKWLQSIAAYVQSPVLMGLPAMPAGGQLPSHLRMAGSDFVATASSSMNLALIGTSRTSQVDTSASCLNISSSSSSPLAGAGQGSCSMSSPPSASNIPRLVYERPGYSCSNCGTLKTTTWRRSMDGSMLCNACGLYYKLHKLLQSSASSRVFSRKVRDQQCSNCHTMVTTMWRRSVEGNPVCNACGLYYKLHKVNRPLSMVKAEIHSRRRKPKWAQGAIMGGNASCLEYDGQDDQDNNDSPDASQSPANMTL